MSIFTPAADRRIPRTQRQHFGRAGSKYLLLLILIVLFVSPFFWLLVTALKDPAELTALPVSFWPSHASLNNFIDAFTGRHSSASFDFGAATINSLFLSTIYAVLVTLSSSLVGFGFARLKGEGKRALFLLMLSTLMLPQIVTLIPTYILFARLGLIDTYWPWILWGLGTSPYLSFLFRQFFSRIPLELEEAAILDGCSYFRIFWGIFLPLSLPVIATSVILSFTMEWGDFISQSLFLSQDNTTLAVGLTTGYLDPHNNPLISVQAAGAILYILPVLLIFFFAQRYFVRGIVTTGLKG